MPKNFLITELEKLLVPREKKWRKIPTQCHNKINLRRIKQLNVKKKNLNLLEENINKYLFDLWVGRDFVNKMKKALSIK